jgi:hypothetical protein
MKINALEYLGDKTTIQILSDKWYWNSFWRWFYYGTIIIAFLSITYGINVTPKSYTEDKYYEMIGKKICCCCKF